MSQASPTERPGTSLLAPASAGMQTWAALCTWSLQKTRAPGKPSCPAAHDPRCTPPSGRTHSCRAEQAVWTQVHTALPSSLQEGRPCMPSPTAQGHPVPHPPKSLLNRDHSHQLTGPHNLTGAHGPVHTCLPHLTSCTSAGPAVCAGRARVQARQFHRLVLHLSISVT